MYWELEFRNAFGDTFNSYTETYSEKNDALTNLYAFYKQERITESVIKGIAVVEVDDNYNARDIGLIVRGSEDEDWEFNDDFEQDEIEEAINNYFLYLRKKIKVCNFSCQDEEDSYYLLENMI